ncbi:MAG: prepilin-type N-terminal cleavage/methylation domain-containing protein [Actinobacteria bacterium]|nr:prepilin-type N-terminal cleavage/methylation domain-containing protein [Actinomycetota bacterium]
MTSGQRGDRADGEGGFTLVEVMITCMIAAIVSASLLGMLDSQTRAEQRMSDFVDNQEAARQAIVAMQRDLRSAEPLSPLATGEEFKFRVELSIFDGPDSTTSDSIRWRVEPDTGTAPPALVRELLHSDGTVAVTHRLAGVANRSLAQPLFTYYRADGTGFSWSDTPGTIAHCTIRIRIDLRAAPIPGPEPVRLVSDVMLRNRLPGGAGCD